MLKKYAHVPARQYGKREMTTDTKFLRTHDYSLSMTNFFLIAQRALQITHDSHFHEFIFHITVFR